MKKIHLLYWGLSTLVFPLTAEANIELQDEINQIKDDIVVIQRKLYRERSDTTAPQESVSSVQMRMGEYDQMIRDMNGKVENIEYRLSLIEKKLETFNKDLDLRFEQMKLKTVSDEKLYRKNSTKSKSSTKSKKKNQLKQKSDIEPKQLYETALNNLKDNKLEKSKDNFVKFLSEFPEDKLAANAQYWLGEVYYKQQNYAQAAIAFKDGYSKYPNGIKGPDCLLKLGLSMKALDKNKEACTAFVNLPTIFGKVNPDIATRAQKEAEALGCKK